jgi:hypothetical protein
MLSNFYMLHQESAFYEKQFPLHSHLASASFPFDEAGVFSHEWRIAVSQYSLKRRVVLRCVCSAFQLVLIYCLVLNGNQMVQPRYLPTAEPS